MHKIARGRVWTGADALKIGLVDKIGGLDDAITYAQKAAKLKEAKIVYYPQHKEDAFDAILEILEEQDGAEMLVKDKQIPTEFMEYYRQLMRLEQVKGIQMRLPYEIKID